MEETFSNTRVYLPKGKKRGEVISYEKLTSEEEAGIIRLYNALVPEPVSEEIDVKLIYEEGFPAFEKAIGKDAFSKLKKYFGIGRGMKPKMSKVPDRKIMALVGQLRTMENATKYISGYKELIEKVAEKECTVDVQYVLENEELENRPLNVASFMGAIKFAELSEYLTEDSVQQDFDVANILLTRAGESSIWSEYQKDEISFEEVKETLKIDATFEKEVLHFKKKETPEETARRFAEECGFPDYDMELLTNVLLSGNEVLFEKYSAEEIDIQKLKKQLGYDDDFADMYFQLKAVDISAIEQRLLEIKKSFSGKSAIQKNRLLVNLYCYLVEGQIPCGIKMKAPRRNKALKPKNLRALI